LLLAPLGILVLLPSLGLVTSFAYFMARQAGLVSRWRSMGSPPGTAVDVLSGDSSVVYVQTASGDIYECQHSGSRIAKDCWHTAREPLSIDSHAKIGTNVYEGQVRPPPGPVADALEVTVWYGDAAFETRYALLEDGTLWKWQYDEGAYWTLGIILLGPAAGLVLGILLVISLWVLAGLQRRRHRSDTGRIAGG